MSVMNRNLLLLIAIIIYAHQVEAGSLQTCTGESTASDGAAVDDLSYLQSPSYYPLSIRNAWTFTQKANQTRYLENIVDSLRLSGELYYRFDHFREFNNIPIRMSEDGKLLMRLDTTEQVWLDFGANVEDSWPVLAPNGLAAWTVILESQTDTVQVQAGTFISCFHFHFQFDGADNDWDEWYAPGVGPVKRLYSGITLFEYPLTNAVIDGKPLPTSVSDQPGHDSPLTFALEQNYPNPFVPARNGALSSTAIRYHLTEAAVVTLRIYDVLGREMITLVNRHELAGERMALWNGRDSHGNMAPSGVYFYRVQAGKQVEVRKLILME
jgi:FlgD Ig-like domain